MKIPILKKCPFCGGIAEIVEMQSDPNEGVGMGYMWYRVRCYNCHSYSPGSKYDPQEAINAWNKRVSVK